MSKSYVSAFRAMTAALLAAEEKILGPNRTWYSVNRLQRRLLQEIFSITRRGNNLIKGIETEVSWEADIINAFLKRNGMTIELQPFGPDTFGFAAIMKVGAPWIVPGVSLPLNGANGETYPGALIEYERHLRQTNVAFSVSRRHSEPIVTLSTQSDVLVHLTKFNQDLDAFDLAAQVDEIFFETKRFYDFGGVHFPMVDLDVDVDVSWLLEMYTFLDDGTRAWLSQALQQFKLRMNHLGAKAEDAFAGMVTLECYNAPKPNLVIDESFLVVFVQPGLSQPLCSVVVRPDAWKDPGDITF
ncbi:hypothetical protein HYV70_04080 [Candidatus Uhrbacteria bacterium]|nr:hypothetical protein [Candidatus Uhrbacteria bacterium]